jgi:hypothetical protein
MSAVEAISLSLACMGELDTSSMAWKPHWDHQVLYTSIAMLFPGELNILHASKNISDAISPQDASAADMDPQLYHVLLPEASADWG